MKYKYYDKGNKLIAESDSPIQFNVARFTIWKNIKPVIEKTKVIKTEVTKKEEVTEKASKKESTNRISRRTQEDK